MKLTTLLFPGFATGLPGISSRQQTPNVMIEVTSATPSGTGCPAGSYSVTYTAPDSWNPNKSGVSVGFDETFFVPLRSDSSTLDAQLRAGRTCNLIVMLRYPIGCVSTSVLVVSHGMHQNDVDARSSITRSFQISTGTKSSAKTDNILGGAYFGEPGILFQTEDNTRDTAKISEGMRDVTLSIDLATEIWSANRTALDWSYIKIDDLTVFLTVDEYSPSC